MPSLIQRKATIDDLKTIVALLVEDKLGQQREISTRQLPQSYIKAFYAIDQDPNQYLMILCEDDQIVGTCHGTLMPSLTFTGSTRLQIEAVRIVSAKRGQKLGEHMLKLMIEWGKQNGARIVQLTTNKIRTEALRFYEQLGFQATHIGMKLYLEQDEF